MTTFTGFDLATTVKLLDGTEAKRFVSWKDQTAGIENTESLTVKLAFRLALTSQIRDEQIADEQKFKNFLTAQKIMKCTAEESVNLSTEEMAEIKKRIAKTHNIEAQGFLWEFIEAKPSMKDSDK